MNLLEPGDGSMYLAYPAGSSSLNAFELNFMEGFALFHTAMVDPVGLTSVSASPIYILILSSRYVLESSRASSSLVMSFRLL